MATIDLGKIKLVNRGAYNNSTAYTVDDLVQSGGSTYICIQNSTGNAVTNNSYWSVLAQGGTDVGTTLTTQGDILYRDGSGLQRLAKGTAAQVLKMNTAANAPEWGNLSSDFVKIASGNHSSDVNSVTISNCFSSTYDLYEVVFYDFWNSSNGDELRLDLLNASDSSVGSSNIMTFQQSAHITVNSNTAGAGSFAQDNSSDVRFSDNDVDSVTNESNSVHMRLYDPFTSGRNKNVSFSYILRASNNYYYSNYGAFVYKSNTSVAGLKFKNNGSANFKAYKYAVWGIKR